MNRLLLLGAVAILALAIVGCDDGDSGVNNPTNVPANINSAALFGVTGDKTLTYQQTDTVVHEDLDITVTSTYRTINIAGAGDDWVIRDGSTPMMSLNTSDGWIILNGCWHRNGGIDSVTYFDVPPVLMPPGLTLDEPWDGYTPPYDSGTQQVNLLFYNAYFGFYFTKTYVGTQLLHLPAGSFDAYRFDVQLFRSPYDSAAAGEAEEYYVPSTGLVKLSFRGGPLKRTLSLIP